MSLNKVMLIGNIGRDPEVKTLDGSNGSQKVATFTLATGEKYKDRNGELRENTEWHNIVAWRNLAEICEKYVRKGDLLYIEGKITNRSWEKDGQTHYITEIVAEVVELFPKNQSNPNPAPQAPTIEPTMQPLSKLDDDQPF